MKHRSTTYLLVAVAFVFILAIAASAGVPRLISYQGKATDAAGNPVPDDTYPARFTIYTASTGGAILWGEFDASVTTTGGLFTYQLGTTNPIPDSLFAKYDSLFLGVMFNTQTLSPRTPLVSTGYAFRVNSVDGASGGTITGTLTIDGTTNCWIDPNTTGNNSVYLPDGAVNDREIFDEPGIAQGISESASLGSGGVCADLVTLEITIPSSGYIVLYGKARLVVSASSGAYVQIDQTSGGTTNDVSMVSCLNPHTDASFTTSLFCHRVYYKITAGTYTYRLEGMSSLASISATGVVLTAMFIPTSYGSVETMVSSTEAQDFEGAVPTQVDGQIRYKVDLRTLELKAAKAEAEAEKAKRELLEAKDESTKDTNE